MDPGNEVLSAARARAAALAAGDAERLAALLHDEFVWTTHLGQRFGREEYVARNTEGVMVWRAQELTDARVSIVGDTAVLVAEVADVVEGPDGQPETFRMPVTQTWERLDHAWQCLAGHAGPRRTNH